MATTLLATWLTGCAQPIPDSARSDPTTPVANDPAAKSTSPTNPSSAATSAQTKQSGDQSQRPLREMMEAPKPPKASNDDAGALGFVRYYVDTMDWAYATADASTLRQICTADNAQCSKVISTVEIMKSSSWTQYGGRSTLAIGSGMTLSSPSTGEATIQSRLLIAPMQVRDATGELVAEKPAYDQQIAFKVRWSDGAWKAYSAVKVG